MTAPQCTDVGVDLTQVTLHRHDCPHRAAERQAAYAAAMAHPFVIQTFPDWRPADGVTVGFQSEIEARQFAARRPEPLIDLIKRGAGVIAARRLVPHPQDPHADAWKPRDDFPHNPDAYDPIQDIHYEHES